MELLGDLSRTSVCEQYHRLPEIGFRTDYEDFLDEPAVQDAMADAKEAASCSPRYIDGVVSAIVLNGELVDYETIADYLGVNTTSDVSKAASALEARNVITKTQQRPAKIDFDLDGIAAIKASMRRREQAERIMEDL